MSVRAEDLNICFYPPVLPHPLPERAININYFNQQDVLQHVCSLAEKHQGYALATLNLDHVVKLKHDEGFFQAYKKQDIVVADGFPIVWLGKLAGRKIKRTAGSELVLPLMQEAAKKGLSIAIVGTTDDVLKEAKIRLSTLIPELKIVYTFSPPFEFDPNSQQARRVLRQIRNSNASVCFVALGAPKQEIFAARGREIVPNVGFVSVGAGIDFIAGKQKRAPKWVCAINMEWFWRMMSNPTRLYRRYAKCMAIFPTLIFKAIFIRVIKGKEE